MTIAEVIGVNVKKFRMARGWSQRALGARFDKSGGHVSKIEAGEIGNVGIETLEGLATALKVSICDLVENVQTFDAQEDELTDQALRLAVSLRGLDISNPEHFFARMAALPTEAQQLVESLLLAVETVYRNREKKVKKERRFRVAEENMNEELNIMGKKPENGQTSKVDGKPKV